MGKVLQLLRPLSMLCGRGHLEKEPTTSLDLLRHTSFARYSSAVPQQSDCICCYGYRLSKSACAGVCTYCWLQEWYLARHAWPHLLALP